MSLNTVRKARGTYWIGVGLMSSPDKTMRLRMASTLLADWATSAVVQITLQALVLQCATSPLLTWVLLVSWQALKHLKKPTGTANWTVWDTSDSPGKMEEGREKRSSETPTALEWEQRENCCGAKGSTSQAAAGQPLGKGGWQDTQKVCSCRKYVIAKFLPNPRKYSLREQQRV